MEEVGGGGEYPHVPLIYCTFLEFEYKTSDILNLWSNFRR